jgi:hypothetical protein
MNRRAFLLSALIGGLVMGILSTLPYINLGNCCFYLWIWTSAILAVFLYGRFHKDEPFLSEGQGAALGAVTGVVGAIVALFGLFINSLIGMPTIISALETLGVDVYVIRQMGTFLTAIIYSIICFFFFMVMYPAFGALGGLLASGVFWKKPKVNVIDQPVQEPPES